MPFGGTEPQKGIPVQGEIKQVLDEEAGDVGQNVSPKPIPKKRDNPPVAVSLIPAQRIALEVAQDRAEAAKQVREMPADPKETPDLIARLGYAEGLARQDKYTRAEGLARMPGPLVDRLRTWLALSDIAREDRKAEDARRCAREALTLFEQELKKSRLSPWYLWQLTRTVARAVGDEAKAKELADSIHDDALKRRAQLELFLLRLEGNKGRVETSTIEAMINDKRSLAYGLALEELVRHNTRAGAGGEEQRASEWSEELRPFVYLGAAVGTEELKR
jgi:hypothetical protein